MKHEQLRFNAGFRVGIGTAKSQVAVMVLPVGGSEGARDNRHRGADQWLYVVEGTGVALINGHEYPLRKGTVVLIERGDAHLIRNTGKSLLKTVNFYVPPAYDAGGEELPAGRSA